MATKYYAVKIGRNPGVYTDCEKYRQQIDGYSGFQARVFKSEQLAYEWLSGNVAENAEKYYAVKIGRVPGIYTRVEDYKNQTKGFTNAVGKSFKSLVAAREWMNEKERECSEASVKTNAKKYYAVRVGRKPGVYTTVKAYRKQTDGFAGFEAKVFNSLELARKFVNANGSNRYYAVRAGRVPGVYTNVEEYRAQVDGYKFAVSKKFKTLEEANSWLAKYTRTKTEAPNVLVNAVEIAKTATTEKCKDVVAVKKKEPVLNTKGMVAYVDGSFNVETQHYAYGVIIIHDGHKNLLSGNNNDSSMLKMRNVAGEISGAMAAMQYAVYNGVKEMTIVHDFNGIADLCTGKCTALNDGTVAYKEFYDRMARFVDIKFQKVESHTGDYYNDLADGLAKNAAGVKVKKTIEDALAEIKTEDVDMKKKNEKLSYVGALTEMEWHHCMLVENAILQHRPMPEFVQNLDNKEKTKIAMSLRTEKYSLVSLLQYLQLKRSTYYYNAKSLVEHKELLARYVEEKEKNH